MLRRPLLASIALMTVGFAHSQAGLAEDLAKSWDVTLARHLRPTEIRGVALTGIDYAALSRGDNDYRKALISLAREDLRTLSEKERLAYWINAYNMLAVKMVIDHWPLDSIRDAGGKLLGRVWKKEVGKAAGETRTLDEIEHEILRKMNEPRMHVAIVCASVSCPDLRIEAYRPDRLDEQLDEQMRSFLTNEKKGSRLLRSEKTLLLSPIFDWFAEDFERAGGSVLDYLLPYLPKRDRKWIASNRNGLTIRFFDYDWGVNSSSG